MNGGLDFAGLNAHLLPKARELMLAWFPDGRFVGKEYACADLRGGNGDSCKVNMQTGLWSDFATGEKGGDLVSLYAAIQGITQGEAFKRLAETVGYVSPSASAPSRTTKPAAPTVGKPPSDAPLPAMAHPAHGTPRASWCPPPRTLAPSFAATSASASCTSPAAPIISSSSSASCSWQEPGGASSAR